MYVTTRVLKMEKGHKDSFITRFNQPFVLQSFDGFVKREVLIDERNKSYDLYRISVYFDSRQAYINWEGSETHKAMHQNSNGHKKEMPGLIEASRETFHELVTLYKNE